MARQVSINGLQAIISQEVSEIFVDIIEITHVELPATLRYVNDRVDITSNGDLYTAFPFRIHMPEDSDDKLSEVTLIISTVDQQIQNALRVLTSPPTVAYSVIRTSTPNTLEVGPLDFKVVGMDYDAFSMRITLGFNMEMLQEMFPKDVFAPYNAE